MKLQNKHIVFITHGIVEERVKKSARALASASSRVTILSLTNVHALHEGEAFSVQYLPRVFPEWASISFYPFKMAAYFVNRTVSLFSRLTAGPFRKKIAIKELQKLQPDVIHAINPMTLAAAAEAAAELGIPYVYESYEFWPDHALSSERKQRSSLRKEILTAEYNYIAGSADVITVSPYLASEYHAAYGLAEEPKVIFNAPTSIVERISPPHKPLRVVFLGSLEPERNLSLLLEAAAKLPNILFTFQGNGSMSEEILEFARTHNLEERIVIKKPVSYSDIAGSASEHDIGIVCHRGYDRQMEGALPNKFFEYLSGGLAVVATETIAFREFPKFTEFGQLINVEKEGSLVSALVELSLNPERVVAMKAAALQAAQVYCGDSQGRALVAIYESIEVDEEMRDRANAARLARAQKEYEQSLKSP